MNEVRRALDPCLGFIANQGFIKIAQNRPVIYCNQVQASFFDGNKHYSIAAAGSDLDPDLAFRKSVFEGFERYTLLAPTRCFKFLVTPQVSSSNCLSGSEFNYFNAEQKKDPFLSPYIQTQKQTTTWIKATELQDYSQREILIPVGCIATEKERQIYPLTTNGMAAGIDINQIHLSAVCEVIERDAFMFSWLSGSRPLPFDFPQLLVDHILLRELWSRFGSLQDNICLRLIPTVFGDYSVIATCVVKNNKDIPFFIMGSAYRPIFHESVYRALLELGQILMGAQRTEIKTNYEEKNFDLSINSFEDHTHFYSSEESSDFLGNYNHLPAVDTVPKFVRSLDRGLEYVLEQCRAHDIRTYAVDLTLPEISAVGGKVIKILSPDLLPLNDKHRARPLGHKRLRGIEKLNSSPHPFS